MATFRQLENPNNWGLRGASLGSYSNLGRLHSPFRPLSEGKEGPRKLPEEGPALPVSRGWYVGRLYSLRSSYRESCRSWGNGTPSLASSLLWLCSTTADSRVPSPAPPRWPPPKALYLRVVCLPRPGWVKALWYFSISLTPFTPCLFEISQGPVSGFCLCLPQIVFCSFIFVWSF